MQVRGSIPLYWNQEGVTHLKPDITLQHYDPLYTATRLHFEVPHLGLSFYLMAVTAELACCQHPACVAKYREVCRELLYLMFGKFSQQVPHSAL